MPQYTAMQRAAFAWVAMDTAGERWQDIDIPRLSFTRPGDDPLSQLHGSHGAGLAKLSIPLGSAAALGFAALTGPGGSVNQQDAEELRMAWKLLLAGPDQT